MNKTSETVLLGLLENLSPDVGVIKLTKTMLEKSIIDANKSVRRLASLFNVDMDAMSQGDKVTIEGVFFDGTPCKVNFYRTKNRADRRVSVTGLKKQADIGDTITLSYKRTDTGAFILVVNVSQATFQADQTFTKSFHDEEMFDHDFNDISIMHENVS
jgi:hypothetical protein